MLCAVPCFRAHKLHSFVAGVETFDVNLETKQVVVKCNVDPQAVLEKVSKTGKKTVLLS